MKFLNLKTALVALGVMLSHIGAQEYLLILHPSNSATHISGAELKRVFNGRMKPLSGTKIVPINQVYTHSITGKLIQSTTDMSVEEYKTYWVQQQIKGKGTRPMLQKSDTAVKLMVASFPGAIGYITQGTEDPSVKVIKTQ